MISRPRLTAALDLATRQGHVVLSAAPGFGKTRLLQQWAGETELDTTFVDIGGMRSVEDILACAYGALRIPETDRTPCGLAHLASVISALPEQARIIIDNADPLVFPAQRAFIADLFDMVATPRFLIATRQLLDLDLGFVAEGGIVEFNHQFLRFDALEIDELVLLSGLGHEALGPAERSEIDGWPLGTVLQINHFQQVVQPELKGGKLPYLGRLDAYFERYCQSVFPDGYASLRDISELHVLDVSSAEAIFHEEGTNANFHRAMQACIVVPDEADQEWRFFTPHLRHYLRRRFPPVRDHMVDLHQRAAIWYDRIDNSDAAIKHAHTAQDWTLLADLLLRHGGWRLIIQWREGSPAWTTIINRVLNEMPEAQISKHPQLAMARLLSHATHGDLIDNSGDLARVEAAVLQSGDEPLIRDLRTVKHLLRILQDRILQPEELERLKLALFELPSSDALSAGLLENSICIAEMDLGNTDAAIRSAQRAINMYKRVGSVANGILIRFFQGQCLYRECRFEEASAAYHRGIADSVEQFGPASDLGLQGNVMLAEIAIDRCDFEEAGRLLSGVFPLIETQGRICIPIAHRTRIHLAAWRGGIAEAHESLIDCVRIARQKGLGRLEMFGRICWIEQLLRLGHGQQAELVLQTIQPSVDAVPKEDIQLFVGIELCHAWIDSEMKRFDAALVRLRTLEQQVAEHLSNRARIDLLILEAAARWHSGDREHGATIFRDALTLAAPAHVLRPFIDKRAMISPVLRHVRSTSGNRLNRQITRFMAEIGSASYRNRSSKVATVADAVLSNREIQILDHVAAKLSNKEIARIAGVTEETVKWYLKSLFAKFSVAGRNQLGSLWLTAKRRSALPDVIDA